MIGLEIFPVLSSLKYFLTLLAIVSGVFVIATKNAIISVFNLIVLYIIVAFYLIYIGIAYLGISYIVVYIGAIAILFLFIIMMIDIEVVEKRSNNYLPLLFLLIVGFLVTLKNILYTMGIMKINSILHKEKEEVLIDSDKEILFDINDISNNFCSIPKFTVNEEYNRMYNRVSDYDNEEDIFGIPSFEANSIKSVEETNTIKSVEDIRENLMEKNNLISEEISSIYADNNYLLVTPN